MPVSDKPPVSFVLLAYNQEKFIREGVEAAFSQTYSPLEILLSDDCSPDRTFEIMREMANTYQGPHKIILNRNTRNLGLVGNLNRTWELTTGQLNVIQAGDDISLPERTEKVVRRWMDHSSPVDLVCCPFEEIDSDGNATGFIKRNVMFVPDVSQKVGDWKCGATGACAAYSRKLHEKYGPVDPRVVTEDWVYSFRAWLESGIAALDEPLVRHRTHENCLSVVHRNVRSNRSASQRRFLRRRSAENACAIAAEWLRAWQKSRSGQSPQTEEDLRRLVRLRELELHAHDSTRLESLQYAIRIMLRGGGFANTMKVLLRQSLRWH